MLYFANKGLFIRQLEQEKYVIQDIFGNSSLPIYTSADDLDEKTTRTASIKKLISVQTSTEFPDLSDFLWQRLEYYYITHIDYALKSYLMSKSELEHYNKIIYIFPIAYLECGYGSGSRITLELVHSEFKKFFICNQEKYKFTEKDIDKFLVFNQAKRICDDIMSLLHRAIFAYTDLLTLHRQCIADSCHALEQLKTNEVIHRGKASYQAATAVTMLVISLCSTLDLSAKLINYINSVSPQRIEFKAARDKQYHEIRGIKPNSLAISVFKEIEHASKSSLEIPELIQFRNDLIHSTSAIELEKIYVGFGTAEINEINLFYSAQYARDCAESGQPIRFLGRDYFVEGKVDIEVKALFWIKTVIDYHLKAGKAIYEYLDQNKKSN